MPWREKDSAKVEGAFVPVRLWCGWMVECVVCGVCTVYHAAEVCPVYICSVEGCTDHPIL